MSVTVKIPTMLKKLFNDSSEVQVSGATIGQILSQLEQDFPGLEKRLNTMIILVDGKDIKALHGLETPVKSENEIRIIPLLSGG